jgi:hypothetical protein
MRWERTGTPARASEERDFGGSRAQVPCLDHLLALKLHALKQSLPHRTSKDAEDVEVLVRRNKVDLRAARYEHMFLNMETEKYTTPSSASCALHDAAGPALELNLPDGEGFVPVPLRLSLAQMIQRSRQLRDWFPAGLHSAEERWQAKTNIAFQL